MKIQCDVCSKEEASVFCSADEAALCGGCDRRVHHANKLASKHIRFSLQLPSSSSPSEESPRCDICQEKRAILFCQEDRAMLCTECDIPIHKANEHTEKHNRFLLTGARLSASSSSSNVGDFATDSPIKSSVSYKLSKPSLYHKGPSPSPSSHCRADMDCCPSQEDSVSLSNTSSISEYLMETLPGWRVDDFLDPSCSHPGLCKFLDHDLESVLHPFTLEDKAIWVPQAPIQSSHIPLGLTQTSALDVAAQGC